jgi:hypothetical protein
MHPLSNLILKRVLERILCPSEGVLGLGLTPGTPFFFKRNFGIRFIRYEEEA